MFVNRCDGLSGFCYMISISSTAIIHAYGAVVSSVAVAEAAYADVAGAGDCFVAAWYIFHHFFMNIHVRLYNCFWDSKIM